MPTQGDFIDPIVYTYPCTGDEREWSLTESKLKEYEDAFDTIDVKRECRLALQWIKDNPVRKKTAKGMTRFLNNWLSKAVQLGTNRKNDRNNKTTRTIGHDYNHPSDRAPFEDMPAVSGSDDR